MNFKDFYSVLLEANVDKRIEYIRKKYGPALESLLDNFTDYKLALKKPSGEGFKIMFKMDFPEYIVKRIDPYEGIYSDWIVRSLLKEPFNNNTTFYRFLTEDFYKVYEDLQKYHRYKNLFKKLGEELNNPNTAKLADINQIKGFDDLYEKLRLLNHLIEEEEEKESLKAAEKEVDKLYDSSNYLILTPKTVEASCAYGRNTRWCTASTGSYNYFDRYNRQGPLYIIIDKKNNRKYQFHFQSNQFMDENDHPLDESSFLNEHLEIKPVLLELAFKNEDYNFLVKHDSDLLIEKFETIESVYSKEVIIKNSFLIAVRLSEKYREFVNKSQKLFTINDEENVIFNTDATEFSDLVDFIKDDNSRYGISRKYAEEILNGETDFYNYDSSFDNSYWDWLNEKSEKLVIKYVQENYPESEVQTISDAREILDENNDDVVKNYLTNAFDDVYNSSISNAAYDKVQSAITDVLGKDYFWNKNNNMTSLSFKWNKKELIALANELQKSATENSEEGPNCDWNSVYSEWVRMLDDNNDLESVDLDRIDSYPSEKEYGNDFNSRFIELLSDDVNEIDLSSINRDMNNFDRYVYKLLGELNMAKGGIANQSGGTAPQQNTASGTQAPPSVSSNPSTKVNQPKTTGTNSSMGMNKTGNQQANPDEMDKMVLDKGTDFNNILQDPDSSTAVFQHISTSLADPNYKNRVALQGVLKNNQNFNKAYTDYIKQYKPLNTPQ